jgi:hypothetical protein
MTTAPVDSRAPAHARPDPAPWRWDVVRVAGGLVVLGLATLGPLSPVDPRAVALVCGAYLLLVLAAALGRLDDGFPVPLGVVLAIDALYLVWGVHAVTGSEVLVAITVVGLALVAVLRFSESPAHLDPESPRLPRPTDPWLVEDRAEPGGSRGPARSARDSAPSARPRR